LLIYIFFVLCEEVSVKRTTTLHGYKVNVYSIHDANIQSAALLTPINHTKITQFESKFRPINTSPRNYRALEMVFL
jgi:hypothetical protein